VEKVEQEQAMHRPHVRGAIRSDLCAGHMSSIIYWLRLQRSEACGVHEGKAKVALIPAAPSRNVLVCVTVILAWLQR
jgi:hypothetical protein